MRQPSFQVFIHGINEESLSDDLDSHIFTSRKMYITAITLLHGHFLLCVQNTKKCVCMNVCKNLRFEVHRIFENFRRNRIRNFLF